MSRAMAVYFSVCGAAYSRTYSTPPRWWSWQATCPRHGDTAPQMTTVLLGAYAREEPRHETERSPYAVFSQYPGGCGRDAGPAVLGQSRAHPRGPRAAPDLLLTPVTTLWHWGLSALAAVVVVGLAASLLGAMGWTVETQLAALAAELPTYTANLKQKMAQVRQAREASSGKSRTPSRTSPARGSRARRPHRPRRRPCRCRPRGHHSGVSALRAGDAPNRLYGARPGDLSAHRTGALRDRLLTFGGYAHVTRTTKALDEAGARISRYLRMQALVNGSFGLLFGLGLFFLGLPYAVLWGFWRPSCGLSRMWGRLWRRCSPSGSASPSSPAGRSRSWSLACLCCWNWAPARCSNPCSWPQCRHLPGGHSRRRALLVLAVGAGGLLLSTPLTVCLSVLGKYVSPLAFLGVVLTDEPVEG